MLPFHFIQVINGTICKRNEDCDRKMEECQRHKDINLQICIRKIIYISKHSAYTYVYLFSYKN